MTKAIEDEVITSVEPDKIHCVVFGEELQKTYMEHCLNHKVFQHKIVGEAVVSSWKFLGKFVEVTISRINPF